MERTTDVLTLAGVAQLPRLTAAWLKILGTGVSLSGLPKEVLSFADAATEHLHDVSRALNDGSYKVGKLRPVRVHDHHGKSRKLLLPTLQDRIVERSIVTLMQACLDWQWSPLSFAYRPGSSVRQAVSTVAQLRDDGATHVVLADIEDCFGSVDRQRIQEHLSQLIHDPPLLSLIAQLMHRKVRGTRAGWVNGVAQGAPLSPLLANIFLDDLDHAMSRHGLAMVRYSDDLLITAPSQRLASRAWTVLETEAATMKLTLKPDKTRLMSFAEGFTFLGEEFLGVYPPVSEELRTLGRQTLYAGERGSALSIRQGRLKASHGTTELLNIPQSRVGRIVTVGPVGLTAGLRQWALYSHTDVILLSARGRYLGSLTGHGMENIRRRTRHYTLAADPAFATALARLMIAGKIANSRALLQRYGSTKPATVRGPLCQLDAAHKNVLAADSPQSILGIEGASANAYWQAFSSLLPASMDFTGRKRRPAPDPVNAALSLGYALLTGEAVGALAAAGLDPAAGFLHAESNGRASLALDLIEEFRPLIVDTMVLEMARRNMLGPDSCVPSDEGGILFTDQCRNTLFGRFERRMLTIFSHTPTRTRCSYRYALHSQAHALARAVENGTPAYTPVGWRL